MAHDTLAHHFFAGIVYLTAFNTLQPLVRHVFKSQRRNTMVQNTKPSYWTRIKLMRVILSAYNLSTAYYPLSGRSKSRIARATLTRDGAVVHAIIS